MNSAKIFRKVAKSTTDKCEGTQSRNSTLGRQSKREDGREGLDKLFL